MKVLRKHYVDELIRRQPGAWQTVHPGRARTTHVREAGASVASRMRRLLQQDNRHARKSPIHFTGDGIMEVGSIPFLLDKSILDKALAD